MERQKKKKKERGGTETACRDTERYIYVFLLSRRIFSLAFLERTSITARLLHSWLFLSLFHTLLL